MRRVTQASGRLKPATERPFKTSMRVETCRSHCARRFFPWTGGRHVKSAINGTNTGNTSTCVRWRNDRVSDGHSCPSHGHENLSKRRLLCRDSRSTMRWCLANVSDMNAQATETLKTIAVGTAVASGPTHRSVHEELPHTAPTLSRARKRSLG